jgi:hypothetical protein
MLVSQQTPFEVTTAPPSFNISPPDDTILIDIGDTAVVVNLGVVENFLQEVNELNAAISISTRTSVRLFFIAFH